MLAAASDASAVTRKQASKKALAALGSKNGTDAVVVFGLTKPVRGGTRVTQAGGKLVAKVGRERAFFFYEDSGPFQPYPHAGRVALVGAKSGKVRLSKSFRRAPRVNGALLPFLKSPRAYRSSKYRIYSRRSAGDAGVFADPLAPGPLTRDSNAHPKADPQTLTVKQNRPKQIVLTGVDSDGDPLLFEITQQPDNGTLSGTPPDLTYTPNTNFLGKDKFAFRAHDGEDHSDTAHITLNVMPRGLPPVVATSGGCTSYTEQAPAVAVDGGLIVADPDDATLDSATVRIATDFVRGDDLVFTDQNGIRGSYDDLTGTLNLVGVATVANYQAALRTVGYRNLAGTSPTASKNVEFTVNDAGGDSAPATKQICITEGGAGDNNKPIGETSEGALVYTENDGPVPVDGAFFAFDADSTHLTGATIKFVESQPPEDDEGNPIGNPVNNFAPAEDELAFTDQNGITGSYDDVNGVMTLSGSATVADYETAIRSVTYENSSEDPSDAARSVRFQVTDSSGASSVPSNRGILVIPVNDAPVVTTTEGSGSATGSDPIAVVDSGLTTLDVDDDDLESARVVISAGAEPGDELALDEAALESGISVDYDGESGVLTLTGTASVADYETALRLVEYRHPDGNPGGTKTIEFTVNDGDLDSAPATKSIEVNDAPVLDTSDDALAYTENDGSVAADSGITAADADSPDLVGATVQISGNYTPAEDTLALAEQNGITGSFDSQTGTLTLSGTATVADYQAALADVRYENSSENPSSATRTLTFQADDGGSTNNLSDSVTRDISVTPVNDAPVLDTSDDALSYTEGDGAVAADSGITAADADSTDLVGATVQISGNYTPGEDTLALAEQNGISGSFDSETGTLGLTGSATVAQYQAALADVRYENSSENPSSATRTLTFQADDGGSTNNLSDSVTRDISVTPVNDAPFVGTDSEGASTYTIGDDVGVEVDPSVAVSDVDDANLHTAEVKISAGFEAGDELVFTDTAAITGDYSAATGVLTLTGSASVEDYQTALSSIKFRTTAAEPSASRTVEFKVNDGPADSNSASRSINLVAPPENTAPVVTPSETPTTYVIGGPAVPVDPGVGVSDDGPTITGGEVKIASNFQSGDSLAFSDQSGITGVYNTGTGVLTLSGTATVAEYETALRSITFGTTAAEPAASKSVEFKVSDGALESTPASQTILLESASL